MSRCNHDKCLRDGCEVCCYCGAELKVKTKEPDDDWSYHLGECPPLTSEEVENESTN